MAARSRLPAWLAALAVAAGTAAAVYLAQGPMPSGGARPSDHDVAVQLRQRAAAACNAGKGQECLFFVNEARERDPAGEDSDEVKLLRQVAQRELEGPLPPPLPTPGAAGSP